MATGHVGRKCHLSEYTASKCDGKEAEEQGA